MFLYNEYYEIERWGERVRINYWIRPFFGENMTIATIDIGGIKFCQSL